MPRIWFDNLNSFRKWVRWSTTMRFSRVRDNTSWTERTARFSASAEAGWSLLESSYGVGASSSWNLYTTHLSLFERWYRLGNLISNLGTAPANQAHRLCTKAETYDVTSTRATSRQNWLSKVREILCSLCLIKESYYKRNDSTENFSIALVFSVFTSSKFRRIYAMRFYPITM